MNLLHAAAFAASLTLGGVSAMAQTWPNCGVAPSSGLGIGGVAKLGCNPLWTPLNQQGTNVYLETGSLAENTLDGVVVMFTINTSGVDAPGRRPVCIAQSAWTDPEYADGLSIPEWPVGFWDSAAYTPTLENPAAPSNTFRFRALDALHGLKPSSSYMVHIICSIRQ